MKDALPIGCVLMAAGSAHRFGENKLLALYDGLPVIEHALRAIPAERFCRVAVVSQYDAILDMARTRGFAAVRNSAPEDGVSLTVRLGLEAMPEAAAAMFMVADQPRLRRASVEAELDFYLRDPAHMVCMGHGARRGNPVIFPGTYFPALRALSGDVGGMAVCKAHPDQVRLFPLADPAELFDVDDPGALARLNEMASPFR